ncbi:alpha/beta fold hydrolase [Spirillospora sp. CA-255316]
MEPHEHKNPTGLTRRHAESGTHRVASLDEGDGPPVLLLHGCPFSAFVWRRVVLELRGRFRCVATDLLGLGDTETAPDADLRLPVRLDAVLTLLDHLGLDRAAVVGHDQGGAIAQMLAAHRPERVTALVLADAEACDNWASIDELPFVRQPAATDRTVGAGGMVAAVRWTLAHGEAVHDREALTDELMDGYIIAILATPHRRTQTRRFLAAQFAPSNQACTTAALEGLRRFRRPTPSVRLGD